MTSKDIVPSGNLPFCELILHVATTLPEYYSTLGITALTPRVAKLLQDAAAFSYLCTRQDTLTQAGQGATRERNRARDGDDANPDVPVNYAYPVGPTAPLVAVLPGIERRFRAFIKWLRTLDNYEAAIAEALHLVGELSEPADPATLQPQLSLRINGLKVIVGWGWEDAAGIAHALHLEVDRGAGQEYLATDTTPDYTDTFPFPVAPAKWRYRGMWMRGSEMIGTWSLWSEIIVGG